ncbi:hypothetical protein CBL_02393 [Carabus blaptoides fortunei]
MSTSEFLVLITSKVIPLIHQLAVPSVELSCKHHLNILHEQGLLALVGAFSKLAVCTVLLTHFTADKYQKLGRSVSIYADFQTYVFVTHRVTCQKHICPNTQAGHRLSKQAGAESVIYVSPLALSSSYTIALIRRNTNNNFKPAMREKGEREMYFCSALT